MDYSLKNLFKLSGFWAFACLSFLALLKQIIFTSYYLDTNEYIEYGKYLFDNHFKFLSPHFLIEFRRTPIYPLWMALFRNNLIVIALFQWLLSILIPIGLLKLWTFLPNTQKSLNSSLWLLAINPIQFYLMVSAMPDFLSELGLLWFLVFVFQKRELMAPIVLGLLILLKPIFVFVLILWIGYQVVTKSWKINYSIIPLFMFLAWSTWNDQKFGVFSVSSVSEENFYSYNRPLILKLSSSDKEVDSIYSSELEWLDSIKIQENHCPKAYQFIQSRNREVLLCHPIYTATMYIKGSVQMLLDPGRYDAMLFWNWSKTQGFLKVKDGNANAGFSSFQWGYILFFMLLNAMKLVLIIVGFWAWKQYSHFQWLLIIAYGICFVCGPVGSARYTLMILPILAVFSTLGIEHLIKSRK